MLISLPTHRTRAHYPLNFKKVSELYTLLVEGSKFSAIAYII